MDDRVLRPAIFPTFIVMSALYRYLFGTTKTSVPSFAFNIEYDQDDDEDNSVVVFVLNAGGGFVCTVSLFDLDTEHRAEAWGKIYQEDPTTHIPMCTSNGQVTIDVTKDTITFTVAKHGAGGDGILKLAVPTSTGLQVLRECHTAWVTRQALFKAKQ